MLFSATDHFGLSELCGPVSYDEAIFTHRLNNISPFVILSSLTGAVSGTVLMVVRGGDRNMRIPFGPFLAVAGWVTVLWGASLQRLYWHWMAF